MVFEIGSGWHQKGDEKVRDRDIEYTVGRRKREVQYTMQSRRQAASV